MHIQWVAALDMLSTFVDALPLEEEEARLGERFRLYCPALQSGTQMSQIPTPSLFTAYTEAVWWPIMLVGATPGQNILWQRISGGCLYTVLTRAATGIYFLIRRVTCKTSYQDVELQIGHKKHITLDIT